jgi:hypothetical protein
MSEDRNVEVEIVFRRETEYVWSGFLADLPTEIRKGAMKGDDLDVDVIFTNLTNSATDDIVATLIGAADVNEGEIMWESVEEC